MCSSGHGYIEYGRYKNGKTVQPDARLENTAGNAGSSKYLFIYLTKAEPNSLNRSYHPHLPRFGGKKEIIEKIGLIRKELGIVGEDILIPKNNSTQISLLSKMEWINCDINSEDNKLNKINSKIKELRENNQLEDITILTTNENTGVDIVKFFMNKGLSLKYLTKDLSIFISSTL